LPLRAKAFISGRNAQRLEPALNGFQAGSPLQPCGRLEIQMTPAIVKPQSLGVNMTREERSDLILAFARVLYVNGESTEKMLAAASRLGDFLGLTVTILPRWGELELQAQDNDGKLISAIEADPGGVDMDRVVSTTRAIEDIGERRLAPSAAIERISVISR